MRKSRVKLNPGQVVRELREKKEWTQKTLSELTGIAVANISNIENGRSNLGEYRAILFATALEVKPEFLLFPNEYMRPDVLDEVKEIKERLNRLKKAG